jgi:hypothetical protein
MLEALGNIGDFLGGLGVVFTLLYLAAQIRQNTRSSRSVSYQAVVTATSQMAMHLWMNSEAARILQSGQADREALDPLERAQFNGIIAGMVRNVENIHYQYVTGAIDRELWTGWELRTRSIVAQPGGRAWWPENKEMFSKDFEALVDGLEPMESDCGSPFLPPNTPMNQTGRLTS